MGTERCVPPPSGAAVTIGAYDGVHLGHQFVIAELRREAAARGLASVVVTFDRHPATVVRPESAPALLTDLDQKLELLAAVGVDRTLVIPFDRDRADESAEDFVLEVLVRALQARLVVVGEDFHFGHGRKGNVALLRDVGRDHGFEVDGLTLAGDPAPSDGSGRPPSPPGADVPAVSSTRIRSLLAGGDVAGAARLLGRPHQVRGVVEPGDGRGRAVLGFPTANVAIPTGIAVPAEGIYACWYERPSGARNPAACSIGRRPTFYRSGAEPLLEAHLIDFDGDLYGEEARVSFVDRLRDDRRFDSVDALVVQMAADVEAVGAALGRRGD